MTRLIVLFALLIAVWTGGRPALGHAVLLETSPASGAVLDDAPREIILRFNETVTPIALTLIGRDGSMTMAAVVHDTSVHAVLPGPLPDGTYIVSYRAVSADSHPIGGAFLFSVGTPSTTAPSVPDTLAAEDAGAVLVIANRILLLGSLFFSAGSVLFAAGVLGMSHPSGEPLYRTLRLGAVLAIMSALMAIVAQGALLSGTALTDPAAWRDGMILRIGWQSSLGRSVTIIGLGLLLIVVFFRHDDRRWPRRLSIAGAVLAIGALAVSGHAMTASPRWLAVTAMALHGLMIGFWIGALWPLLRCLHLPAAQAAPIVARFSGLAVVAVAILVATGLILAVLQLGGVAALLNTRYGQLLLLKLALVALLLLLASYNKFRLTPALARGEPDAAARLSRAIRLEIAAAGLIVTVAVLLGQTPPRADATRARDTAALHAGHHGHPASLPQTLAQTAAQSATAEAKGYVAVMTLALAPAGRNTLSVALRTPEGAPFDALEVNAEFSLTSAGIEPLSEPLRPVGAGRYELTTDVLIQPGQWRVSLAVLVSDFERVHFGFDLVVGAR